MPCTISQAPVALLCTSGVIYGEKGNVHHAYMAKKHKPAAPKAESKRWRKTLIATWRDAVGMTQQAAADALAERGITRDRVSVGRIEGGKQMPSIEVLEALAKIYKTDVDSMLNYTPEQAKALREFRELKPEDQLKALQLVKVAGGGK